MRSPFARFGGEYGMFFALLLLCGALSWATYSRQTATGAMAGDEVAAKIKRQIGPDARTLIVVGGGDAEAQFAQAAKERLGPDVVMVVQGSPADLRAELSRLSNRGERIDAIAAGSATGSWTLLQNLGDKFPQFANVQVFVARDFYWPTFLMPDNLLAIANQVAVSAIVAIGMTMVIILGGIDLSVGSLLALSAVCTALVIEHFGGGATASGTWMIVGGLCGIAVGAACGLFSGVMITAFRIPAFIVTLAMLLIARGSAQKLTGSQSIGNLPAGFTWLGMGSHFGLPNAVLLMLILYLLAYVVMSRTTFGRYIYAIGGNAQAARLCGVRVERVTRLVYIIGGALAGLGGVILASQFKSGDPNFGQLFELRVIAAVVVGGASLNGGQGKILGTLIGTLFIGVIDNGMNVLNIESNSQTIALGIVILGAVLLDTLKHKSWRRG